MTGAAGGAPLRMLVWPGMPAPEALERVAARLGVALDCETICTNEQLEERLLAGERWDLVTPSDFMVERLAARGLLAPLDAALLPGRDALAPWARRPAWDPAERWSVPLAFGTTGVLHDRERLPDAGSWRALLDPPPGVVVGLLDEPREVIGAALLAAGERFDATDERALAAAGELLRRGGRAVARVDSGDFVSPVRDGLVAAHHAWSGPAAAAVRADPRLAYSLPGEGAVVWVTTVAIAASCPRPALARAAIAALLDPELARITVEQHSYATPNDAARRLLPAELRDDPVLFPSPATLRRAITIRDVDPAAQARLAALWADVAAGAG
ncbi:polyamine ABC transporter substrate-binding protein [Conexibacter woesei]|uniref:Spermidine/putrescine ABC transporter, periplasmic spermidine/putrescine-binding protein PotD n=1 Tax=Conexibacter woesei (strain DSM 14684 / CCUG 47730 / CIP 108061 / JCM 11494 / NBRC 100937 / ID131577) TaxID=469383 RepID=D3F2J5_CONWI|nr:spermidine/putrescine ABC transporter substrate-binding protein [Conexibacter woesei]ADB52261.1 spermidine/putrescine ABC transporter, periplasmic spermidine/putrescine-binding protein PotD [Conexibacter woesei DSM 14684]